MSVDSGTQPRYPHEWEADVVLVDGATAQLRPIRPEDADALQRFHTGQSARSIYMRFFTAMPELPPQTLHRLTHVDHHDRVALVATIGDDIVGVGRYDTAYPGTAEVAFAISDAHQERGLGSVLLEHLAAIARENGIERFLAEVLPENKGMLGVLRDAGYELRGGYEDGMMSLSFRIDPTERSLAVMEAREHRSESVSLRGLLRPGSVAVVVGEGERERALGRSVLRNLLDGRFAGRLAVVDALGALDLGAPVYPAFADVPAPVDLVVAALAPADVVQLVKVCRAKAVRGVVVVSGGFAEEGTDGVRMQRRLLRTARKHGIRLVGPNSWGLLDTRDDVRLNASVLEQTPAKGPLGIFAQSGVGSVLAMAALVERGVGVSSFISAGNRVDVSGNDCLQYWEQDEDTRVVGLFLESIGNPRKFSRIARRLSRHKPVIVVTSGNVGVSAPPGHKLRETNAPPGAFEALLQQSGCICVDTVPEMLDVAQLVVSQPLPQGPRVAIVSNAHSLQGTVMQVCRAWHLDPRAVPVLPPAAQPHEVRDAVLAAAGQDDVDAVVIAVLPPLTEAAPDLLRLLGHAAIEVPVAACVVGPAAPAGGTPSLTPPVREVAVPSYRTPAEAVQALALAARYRAWRDRGPGVRPAPCGDRALAKSLIGDVLARNRRGAQLTNDEAARLLSLYGIDVWPWIGVKGEAEALAAAEQLGYPVALKATSRQLRHRMDLGAVRLGIAGPGELVEHLAAMHRDLGELDDHGLVVQRMAPLGVACVLSTMEDPLIGPIISFGIAGDASDLLGDIAYRIPPLSDSDVVELVSSVWAAPKLFGHRGADPVDVGALYALISKISCLAEDLPEVAELQLIPVVVARQSLAVLGATVRVAPAGRRSDAGIRRLTLTGDADSG